MNTIDNDSGEVIQVKPAFTPRKVKAAKRPPRIKPVDGFPMEGRMGLVNAFLDIADLPANVERTLIKSARTVQRHGKGITVGALVGVGVFAAIEIYSRTKGGTQK